MNPLNLYPFPLWLTPQLPAVNANAISYEMLIREFIYKLNEVIKRCNDVQAFSEEVKRILDEMNAHIFELVIEQLEEMYENGELEELLERVSQTYFNQFSTMLNEFEEQVNNRFTNINNNSFLRYSATNKSIELYINA